MKRRVQFSVSGWFLTITTFVVGYGIGRFDYEIQQLIHVIIWLLSGKPSPC